MNIQSISPSTYQTIQNNSLKTNNFLNESKNGDIFSNNLNSAITTSLYKAGIDPNSIGTSDVNMAENAKQDSFNKLMNTLFESESQNQEQNNILGISTDPTVSGDSTQDSSNSSSEILSIGQINYNAVLAKIETLKSQINSGNNLETNKFVESFTQIAGSSDPKIMNSFLSNLSEEFSNSNINPVGNNINYTA